MSLWLSTGLGLGLGLCLTAGPGLDAQIMTGLTAVAPKSARTPARRRPALHANTAPGVSPVPYGPPAPAPAEQKPLRPEQMPPVAPNVEYQSGQLSVHTANSTLGSVLNAIHSKTGIEFEGVSGGAERVAVSLGPAPPGEVLNGLFLGSRFDYIIIGNQAHPEKVILSPRNSSGLPTAQNTATAGAQNDEEGDGDNGGEEANSPSEMVQPQDRPIQPVPRPQTPPMMQQNPSAPKTPEQLLQELQRMRQQQQQQQQNPPQQQPPL